MSWVIFDGELSISQFRFIHLAGIDNLHLNYEKWNPTKLYFKWLVLNETQLHVYRCCSNTRACVYKHHNDVLKILLEHILRHNSPYINSNQRVDLQIEDKQSKTIFLIDFKCPIYIPKNIERINLYNMDHYNYLNNNISNSLPG